MSCRGSGIYFPKSPGTIPRSRVTDEWYMDHNLHVISIKARPRLGLSREDPYLSIPCHIILRLFTPGMTRLMTMCVSIVLIIYTENQNQKEKPYTVRAGDWKHRKRERERAGDIVLSGLSHCYCHNL